MRLSFKRDKPDGTVIAFDNLKRRGSELALRGLPAGGVEFRHGDIRNPEEANWDLLLRRSITRMLDGGTSDVISTLFPRAAALAGMRT